MISITNLKLVVLSVALAFAGCKGDDAPVKTATPATPATTAPAASAEAAPAPSLAGQRQTVGEISWETPAGWSPAGEKPMRLATLSDGTAEIAITSFGGDVGGLAPNVARWRGQLGLPPLESDAEAEKSLKEVDAGGVKIRTLDLTGAQARMLVAIVPGDGKHYFFKLMAPPDVVAARKDAFDKFVKSIRVGAI